MLRVLLSSVALLLFTSVQAQQYPSRPIRFVMAYPPGGSSDALARPIANEMTKGLGQPLLLEITRWARVVKEAGVTVE